jgi:hypothetical protein
MFLYKESQLEQAYKVYCTHIPYPPTLEHFRDLIESLPTADYFEDLLAQYKNLS